MNKLIAGCVVVVLGWVKQTIRLLEWVLRRLLFGMFLSISVCIIAILCGYTEPKVEAKIRHATQAQATEPISTPPSFASFGKLDTRTIKYICEQAESRRIACPIALALVQQESSGDPWLTSSAGAIGLMQVMPQTARSQCKEVKSPQMLWDTLTNIRCGLTVLRNCLNDYKEDVFKALYCYNGSTACAETCRTESNAIVCVNRCPETYRYARQVVARINQVEKENY